MRKLLAVLSAGVVVLAVVGGCSGSPAGKSGPSAKDVAAVSPSPSPPPSPSLTQDEADIKAVEQLVLDYWALYDRVRMEPSSQLLQDVGLIARDTGEEGIRNGAMDNIGTGKRMTSPGTVELLSVAKNADGDWEVEVCRDSSQSVTVDADGQALSPPDGFPARAVNHHVVHRDATDGKLYVMSVRNAWPDGEIKPWGMNPC
jgi:hypothetical protein